MEHPDGGPAAPDAGASRPRDPDRDQTAAAQSRGQAGVSLRQADRVDASDRTGKSARKRRKRKRGRKVFAREPAPPTVSSEPIAIAFGADSPVAARELNGQDDRSAQQRAPRASGPPAFRAGGGDMPVYAALDLGTNNCRLLVAIPTRPGQFRVIDAYSRIVRLGEGLTASGRLGDAAMDRAVEALTVCADKLALRDVRAARLVATEACRSAGNGEAFLARVTAETGLSLEIIDRQTEARLAVSGCGSLVEKETKGVVLFDIGGGSSEIALVDLSHGRSPRLANHIVAWTSLPIGVVSLAERFGGREVTRDGFAAMIAHVADLIDRFPERGRLAAVEAGDAFHLLGTSGTVTTIAGVHLGLERYDRRKVDGLWLAEAEIDTIVDRLLGWSFEERVANACIGLDRADLVLAGCAILEAIRAVWPAKRLRVADRGLREGILSELMANDGAWRRSRRMLAG